MSVYEILSLTIGTVEIIAMIVIAYFQYTKK